MTLQQQIDDLRKYHEALGTKLASLERHLEADEVLKAPTMERQPAYTVSSDGSVMHEGRRYSFKYSGAAIENVLILKAYPLIIQHADGVFYTEAITNVREVKEPAKEWEIVDFLEVADNALWTLRENGKYTKGYIGELSLDNMLHINRCVDSVDFIIHAVRRLSDGTVWKVGDTVSYDTHPELTGVIKLFTFDGYPFSKDRLYAKFTDSAGDECTKEIRNLRLPKALFTTADGVGVFSRQTRLWWLRCVNANVADIWEGIEQVWVDMPGRTNEVRFWKRFAYRIYSTEAAAQAAYDKWLFEQPVLTLNDLEFRGLTGQHRDELKQIVKEKMGKK